MFQIAIQTPFNFLHCNPIARPKCQVSILSLESTKSIKHLTTTEILPKPKKEREKKKFVVTKYEQTQRSDDENH
jgi:hypothetical protein